MMLLLGGCGTNIAPRQVCDDAGLSSVEINILIDYVQDLRQDFGRLRGSEVSIVAVEWCRNLCTDAEFACVYSVIDRYGT